MASVTDTLRVQHRHLEQLAFDLDEALQRSDEVDVAYCLVRLKRALAKHLEVERIELYQALSEVAEHSRMDVASELAVGHAQSLLRLDSEFSAFFQRHSRIARDLEAIRREWAQVKVMLFDRIAAEEELVYPTFETWLARPRRRRSAR